VVIGKDNAYYDPEAFGNERTFESRCFDGASVSVPSLVNNTETKRALAAGPVTILTISSANFNEAIVYKISKTTRQDGYCHIESDSFVSYSTEDVIDVLVSIWHSSIDMVLESWSIRSVWPTISSTGIKFSGWHT
jgi:hypothetical protein